MNGDVEADWKWASERRADVREILSRHLALLSGMRFADADEDTKQATDLVVESTAGAVALRIRDSSCKYRDLTLRSARKRPDGSLNRNVELKKIRDGRARWYFYAWTTAPTGRIGDYLLIDLDRLRASGLLDGDRPEKLNEDKVTFFVKITVEEMRAVPGCLLVDNVKTPRHLRGVPTPSVKGVPPPLAPPPPPVVRQPQQRFLPGFGDQPKGPYG